MVPDNTFVWWTAFKSAQKGHTECLQLLVDCKADLNKAKIDGATPAFVLAQEGHVEAMRILINLAADVNATMTEASCHIPLDITALQGHLPMYELSIASKRCKHGAARARGTMGNDMGRG